MPRKPKSKDGLTAGERVRLYEEEQKKKRLNLSTTSMLEESIRKGDDSEKSDIRPVHQVHEKKIKILPKPQHATVKVDFSMNTGRIKPLHGMCNGPVSYGADISGLFHEIGVPSVRFSGTDTAISAFAVDVSRIFKNVNGDPSNPENYDFLVTDKYVAAAYNSGARVVFRLGESRDRMGCRGLITVPDDIDLFCEVCINIVKHYNDYWAEGYAYGIEYFEIWNHDLSAAGRNLDREMELYHRLSTSIKLYDENIKVGGMGFEASEDGIREFVKFCRKNRAPIDFITLSSFDSSPENVVGTVRKVVPILRNSGFGDTEIMVGEWSYVDGDVVAKAPIDRIIGGSNEEFCKLRQELFFSQSSIKGAAYCLAMMLNMQSVNEISGAYFYDAQPNISPFCAICDRFGNKQKPFYAFLAYGELYRASGGVHCVSEQYDGYAHTGIYASAALSSSGEGYVLIASFGGCGVVDVRLDEIPSNVYTADVYILDGVKNMELGDSIQISGTKKRLLLNISEYGAVMIKLY